MNDLKTIVAKNISDLRKRANFTQAELANNLNYSDKAVSKWERAESLPDIVTLKEIAVFFNVSLDYLTEETHGEELINTDQASKIRRHNRMIIAMLSAALVFLISTIIFVVLGLFAVNDIKNLYLIYIYAIPVSCIVLLVFNSIWGKRIINFILISILLWSIIFSIFFSFTHSEIRLIFLIGIPTQVIIFLWANLKTNRTIKKYGDDIVNKHFKNKKKNSDKGIHEEEAI